MRRVACIILLVLGWGQMTPAGALILGWNPSPTATGYKLYFGTSSGMYQEVLDAHDATQVSVGGLQTGYTYFFAASAYNAYGESGYSNEISQLIGAPDQAPPVVSLTSPLNGSGVPRRQVVTMQAQAADDVGVVLVVFLVDGEMQCEVMIPPYACDWKVPAANKRVYQLAARALDAVGHVGQSPIVEVTAQ